MIKKYDIEITQNALKQMREIKQYITEELAAPEAANNLMSEFYKAFKNFESMPKRLALVNEESWRTEGIRKVLVKNFIVYIWVDEANGKVHVVSVLYNKQNQLEKLKDIDI